MLQRVQRLTELRSNTPTRPKRITKPTTAHPQDTSDFEDAVVANPAKSNAINVPEDSTTNTTTAPAGSVNQGSGNDSLLDDYEDDNADDYKENKDTDMNDSDEEEEVSVQGLQANAKKRQRSSEGMASLLTILCHANLFCLSRRESRPRTKFEEATSKEEPDR